MKSLCHSSTSVHTLLHLHGYSEVVNIYPITSTCSHTQTFKVSFSPVCMRTYVRTSKMLAGTSVCCVWYASDHLYISIERDCQCCHTSIY